VTATGAPRSRRVLPPRLGDRHVAKANQQATIFFCAVRISSLIE